MEKKDFESATGIKTTDIMFKFIKAVASNCKETEFEFYKKWKDGRTRELFNQLTPDGMLNLTQKLAFDLEKELINKMEAINVNNNCINRSNNQIKELESQLLTSQDKCKEYKREIKEVRKENDEVLSKIFAEIFINDKQYLGSDEEDVEYKDFKDLQATLAEYFDKKKIIIWKLQRHVALSSDELKYVQSRIND